MQRQEMPFVQVPVTNSYVHGITKPMVSDPSLPTMR